MRVISPTLRSVVTRQQAADERVSVVLPAYNAARFLRPAIESILAQTHRRFELIVVDDGSTDETAAIAREYARSDRRVRVLSIPHAGVSVAMNRGAAAARHGWLAVMHADDVAAPNRLEAQLRAAREQPDVVAWGSYALHINEKGKALSISVTGPHSIDAFIERRRAARPVLIVHSSALIRKDVFDAAGGYDARLDTGEDLELFDRLSDFGPIVALTEPLVMRRIHAGCNTMRTYTRMNGIIRYVYERRHAASTGRRAPDLDSFLRARRERTILARAKDWIHGTSRHAYHKAAISYGSGQIARAAFQYLGSACLDPVYAVPRLWRQFLAFRLVRADAAPAYPRPASPALRLMTPDLPYLKATSANGSA